MTDAVVFQRRSSAGPACAGVEAPFSPPSSEWRRRPRVRGGRGAALLAEIGELKPAPRARG